MTATHRNLVAYQGSNGGFVRMDSEFHYDGEPNWKFEPLDAVERARWEKAYANPDRVAAERGLQWRLPSLRPLGENDIASTKEG